MEITEEMSQMFIVNQKIIDKLRCEKASNSVLDAADDFCDFINDLNRD